MVDVVLMQIPISAIVARCCQRQPATSSPFLLQMQRDKAITNNLQSRSSYGEAHASNWGHAGRVMSVCLGHRHDGHHAYADSLEKLSEYLLCTIACPCHLAGRDHQADCKANKEVSVAKGRLQELLDAG